MDNPVRILHVVVNMNRGGAETLLMNLYRNIDRTKVQFDFLTCKPGAYDAEIAELGGTLHRIPYITDVGHAGYIKALDHFFASHPEYAVVHSHMDKMSGYALRSAKRAHVPVRIAHSHNTSSEGGFAAKAYKWVAGQYIKRSATHFLACSSKAAQWLFADRGNQTPILKNGIECDKFAFSLKLRGDIRGELGIPENTFVIGHVGRFAHQKNHSFLIDMFAQLSKNKPDTVLFLVGDGPLRADIEERVRDLNLTNKIKFLGIRSDIHQLLQAFDIFVFPSLHEGLPVSLIEAQAAGLPCVISDVISPEADMGIDLVRYVPLSDKQRWVDEIKTVADQKLPRHITAASLADKGYDIRNTAAWSEGFYLAVSR